MPLPARGRLHALTRAAQIWQAAGQLDRACAVWESIRADEALRQVQGIDRKGTPASAGDYAAAILARLGGERQMGLVRSELRQQAREHEQAKRHGAAAYAYRRLLAAGIEDEGQATVLVALARVYEREPCWRAAREVWERLAHDHGDRVLADLDAHRPVRNVVADRLRAPPYTAAAVLTKESLPLFRTWHVTLGSDEWVLAGGQGADSELLLSGGPAPEAVSSRPGIVFCRNTLSGETHWRHLLPFVPRWAGCHADTILAGGERGIACLRRDDGELLWHFPAPASGRYPIAPLEGVRVVVHPRTPEPLTDFQAVSGRLFFLQGQRRLFALDADTGRVLWDRWAPDGGFHLPYPQGCYSPCYHAGAATVLIQTPGRCWLLDAASGRPIHQEPDGRELWQRPPLELDDHTLCIVTGKQRVLRLDARNGQRLWTHTPTGGTTRSGEAPHVASRGDILLMVTPANVGYFVQRLDRATGKPVWPRSFLLTMPRVDISAWAFDPEALYIAEDRSLTARSLADGRLLWTRPLDGGGDWQVRRVGDYLAVYPGASAAEARFSFRSPLGSVQWNLGPLLTPEAVFALHGCDPKTGRLVQRLNFRIESPARTTCERRTTRGDRGRFLLLQTSPLLASAEGPVVRLDSPQPFVAAGGEVWGLTRMNH